MTEKRWKLAATLIKKITGKIVTSFSSKLCNGKIYLEQLFFVPPNFIFSNAVNFCEPLLFMKNDGNFCTEGTKSLGI